MTTNSWSRPSCSLFVILLIFVSSPAGAFLDQLLQWVQSNLYSSKSYGVVIGIDTYEHTTSLNYAVNDARTMIELLKSQGFIVDKDAILLRTSQHVGTHISRDLILDTVKKIFVRTEPNDRVVVFYAGHGGEIEFKDGEKEAFLLPSNYEKDNIERTGLSFRDLARLANRHEVKAKHILFILDACYAADALNLEDSRDIPNYNPLDKEYFKDLLNGRFIAVITAGGRSQKVRESQGHGVFTKMLSRGLAGYADTDGNGLIHFQELVTWLAPKVHTESGAYHQHIGAGRISPGTGQIIFLVPPDDVKARVLGNLDAVSQLTMELRIRRERLREARGHDGTYEEGDLKLGAKVKADLEMEDKGDDYDFRLVLTLEKTSKQQYNPDWVSVKVYPNVRVLPRVANEDYAFLGWKDFARMRLEWPWQAERQDLNELINKGKKKIRLPMDELAGLTFSTRGLGQTIYQVAIREVTVVVQWSVIKDNGERQHFSDQFTFPLQFEYKSSVG